MVTREFFNEVIKDVLGNLYDVTSLESYPSLFSVIPLPSDFSGNKGEYVRQFILEGIEQLRPARENIPATSPEWRPYLIIYKRYVDGIGIQGLSESIAVSQRQMRRDHHKALQTLTDLLWKKCYPNNADENTPEVNPVFEVHNEVIDPMETTRGVYTLLKKQFESKGIVVEFIEPKEYTPVITDRVILRQVLISLFNDILHNQTDQNLTVTCSSVEENVQIKLSSQVANGQELPFDGEIEEDLTTVRYWCEQIHAHIEENVARENAKVWINRILCLPHSDQKILLVIDDQEAVVSLFKRYLSQSDILTIGIKNPEQAISLAHHLRPALITLDVMMPQIDGWELLQHIKLDETLKNIPVIVCSAWDDPDLSRSLGAAVYLKKPVTQKMLLQAVNQVLDSVG